ncbi:zinc-dependent alcohol dehydrogenase family protein [Cohnella cholangitidis]|uniref:Zinc-dependent alcohol dehydrogenase family protein n=2 Tax=Cohnella cholangitidis TaxID=2598458 RepID=A0A7G5C756_9BACL|nr:zinc-dependent alcohol dehydrogenase family protein [Cohnella cholangitidis]
MKALVVESPGNAVVRMAPVPRAQKGEIVVRVKRAGICGTDLHIYKGEYLSPYPIIPGHEFAGVVHEVGDGVEGFLVGDRVSADPNLSCGRCRFCVSGRSIHCERWDTIGVTLPGAMAEYVAVPAEVAAKLPDSLSFAQGAFIEPVACVVQALNRLSPRTGDRALLFGAGAMGQQWVQALARSGVSELVVVDLAAEKLELASRWGATKVLHAGSVASELQGRMGKDGFDIVVDTTGVPQVIANSFQYIGPCGRYVQFGVTKEDDSVQLRTFDLYQREWTLIGSMALSHTFAPALAWLEAGRINTEHLVTREVTLEGAVKFLQGDRSQDDMKVQISFE